MLSSQENLYKVTGHTGRNSLGCAVGSFIYQRSVRLLQNLLLSLLPHCG